MMDWIGPVATFILGTYAVFHFVVFVVMAWAAESEGAAGRAWAFAAVLWGIVGVIAFGVFRVAI
ncbi:hypothetical protein N0B44_15685 [Roseibacterium beibuensis]|uniref:Cardiolipin synthase N-terminal domain-containing protein n=1 Tax=[Roseibacterium] beibuensis TaxID=1193142 RepID=A0ABP9L8Y6_9RHOB|nr:hypothetical protein [Roseibacterium beibuensis]MCS6624360.1 hypothetical protein [Roseibacterium beibuensis]